MHLHQRVRYCWKDSVCVLKGKVLPKDENGFMICSPANSKRCHLCLPHMLRVFWGLFPAADEYTPAILLAVQTQRCLLWENMELMTFFSVFEQRFLTEGLFQQSPWWHLVKWSSRISTSGQQRHLRLLTDPVADGPITQCGPGLTGSFLEQLFTTVLLPRALIHGSGI